MIKFKSIHSIEQIQGQWYVRAVFNRDEEEFSEFIKVANDQDSPQIYERIAECVNAKNNPVVHVDAGFLVPVAEPKKPSWWARFMSKVRTFFWGHK